MPWYHLFAEKALKKIKQYINKQFLRALAISHMTLGAATMFDRKDMDILHILKMYLDGNTKGNNTEVDKFLAYFLANKFIYFGLCTALDLLLIEPQLIKQKMQKPALQ